MRRLLVFFLALVALQHGPRGVLQVRADEPDSAAVWQRLLSAAEESGDQNLQDYLRGRQLVPRPDQQKVFFALPDPSTNAQGPLLPTWEKVLALGRQESSELISQARLSAANGEGGMAYRLLWQAHYANPANRSLAKMLGADEMLKEPLVQAGSRAINEIGWPARSYQEVVSANFRVATTGPTAEAIRLAMDLEKALAVWRQVLLPTWTSEAAIAESIQQAKSPLVRSGPPMRVVLFPDRHAYNSALSRQVPGIEHSTGYYSPNLATTFLFGGNDGEDATRYHELTHQFLQEASRFRGARQPGKEDGFWVVEGIATFAESLRWLPQYATIGGWESPRLQTARYRWIQQGHRRNLSSMIPIGQAQLATVPDLAQWYTDAAVYVHFVLENDSSELRDQLLGHLESVYRRGGDRRWDGANISSEAVASFLQVDDAKLRLLTDGRRVTDLCLGGTTVSPNGLAQLPDLPHLKWLDLAGLPVTDELLAKLLKNAPLCQRLNLEQTMITENAHETLGRLGGLRELDISSTRAGDRVAEALCRGKELRILWASGSAMTDAAIALLATLPRLERIDVQRSQVTANGIAELKRLRPDLDVNPLEIR